MINDKRWYVFTFGSGQQHQGHYVRIYGTAQSARDKMFERYGKAWCSQYTEAEWEDWVQRAPAWVPVETLLEEINQED